MLDLNDIRAQFAAYLASNANKRHSLDAALMHVVEAAYRKGIADGIEQAGKHEPGQDHPLRRNK